MGTLKICKFLLVFCLAINVVCTKEAKQGVKFDENYTERYIELQFAYSRLQLEFYRLRKTLENCTGIKQQQTTSSSSSSSSLSSNSASSSVSFQTSQQEIKKLPKNCVEATKKLSGVYELAELSHGGGSVLVDCDFETQGGGWTVIQRRINGTVNFNRNWDEYKKGFGNVATEYWLGLDNIHALTTNSNQELLILLEDFDKDKRWARYSSFSIGNETDFYAIKTVGVYSGTAGDSLTGHLTEKFSTYDRDNDTWEEGGCAKNYQGGWWFNRCLTSHLNGPNLIGEFDKSQCCRGLHWLTFRGEFYSLKSATMMIRPKDYKP